MNTNINIGDIEKINIRKLHALTSIIESTIKLLRHLKLLLNKLNGDDSSSKSCNNWYTSKSTRETGNMFP